MKTYKYVETPSYYPELIGQHDHNVIDYRRDDMIFMSILSSPTPDEIRQFSSSKKEVRLTQIGHVLWFTFKFGTLAWAEAPFSPHLVNQVKISDVLESASEKITIVLVDSENGKVVYSETLKPARKFITALKESIAVLLHTEFDKSMYDKMLLTEQQMYTTEQIAAQATASSDLRAKRLFS